MFGIGTQELIIIFLIVLVLFGPKALPQLGKALGGGIRELKKSMNSADEAVDEIKKTAGEITEVKTETVETKSGDANADKG